MVTARKFVLAKHFEGEPKISDLKIIEEELPPIKDGEILLHAEYLSVDPYMRRYTDQLPLGTTMIGGQVAKIVESKHPDYLVGERMVGWFGWRSHTIMNMKNPRKDMMQLPYIQSNMDNLSSSLGLGVVGRPGNTAYFGFLEVCKPKAGEVLVVSGAAGAVGSHVGQIGKIMGLKVIGIAGTDEKCKWIKDECGFNYTINYKTQKVSEELQKFAPDGIDCYFDNVGGEISSSVIYQMKPFGRIAVCGSISSYNADVNALPKTTILQPALVSKQLRVEGFKVSRWEDRFSEGIAKNLQWIREGKLKYRETVTHGFENMFHAFFGMLQGGNIGKAIVKV